MKKLALAALAAVMIAGFTPAGQVAAAPPAATSSLQAAQAAKPCKAKKKPGKDYWTCVTPGSYCPKVARKKYGYAYRTLKRYRCMEYSNKQWRWKRV